MARVKKTWLMGASLVRRAQRVCDARTETETVTRALKEMLLRDEIDRAFRRYGPELTGIAQVFPHNNLPKRAPNARDENRT